MDIDLRRLDRFMSEPERNDGLIDAMVEQLHGCTVAQGMWAYPLTGQAWAGARGGQTVFADQMFQGVTREWFVTDGREQWPIILSVPFLQPVTQRFGRVRRSGVQRSFRPLPTQRTCAPVPRTTSLQRRPISSDARRPVCSATSNSM